METKKVTSYIRGLECESCKTKLLSIYVRSKNNFKSLLNYYYCSKCKKVFLLDSDDRNSNKIVE